MEIHFKKNKEKSNKIKLKNKKLILSKNLSFVNKALNRTDHNNNKMPNISIIKNKTKIISNNLKKYNTTIKKYNTYIINAIIFDQRNHIVAVFKNYLLWDETSEFLKRYYRKKDNTARLPKIAEYYEQYTLFIPNYFGNEGLIILIMLKFMKRKKKYMKYLEEKEDEDEKKNNKKNKNNNNDFEPLFKNELTSKTKSKSLFSSFIDNTKNTLELTNYENDSNFIKKINRQRNSTKKIIKDLNENKIKNNYDEKECNNSMSFTEIFDDLSSHFSILINSNNYKDYIQKSKKIPIKSFTNKVSLVKKGINPKNYLKKLSTNNNKQKSMIKKETSNKQQNESKNESNNYKKDTYKISKYKKQINSKKITPVKSHKVNEKEKYNDNEKVKVVANKDKRKMQTSHLVINNSKQKDNNNLSKNIINKKNISIVNNNTSKNNKLINNDDKFNIMNTITNIKSQYYSLGKLMKNKKQRSAIKKVSIKSLNLVNFNQNIPNIKKIINNKNERRIIFPRNVNYIYNNNTNKLNSIKGDQFEHIKLLTDRDKENVTLVNNTNESSKITKLNDNYFLNNNRNYNMINHKRHDIFAQKVGKLIKKKNISLISDNLSSKDTNNKNSIGYKNEKNDISDAINININNLNNMHYKKNSVLRQFNSKKDFNLINTKNKLFYNYNNVSNNSINSSSSSSLNNLNKKKYKLSNNAISQNNSMNKNRKSLQKINLNLNLQINFNINIDKKNKKIILAKRLHNRIFNEINHKNNKYQNNKGNNSNSNSIISIPFTQRYYYNINKKYLSNFRSSSSSNSKKKQKIKKV